jgi:hypothetical protein
VSSATSPISCSCTEITVCDECASRQIEALNASTNADCVELLPGVLTPSEQSELRSVVAGWLGTLGRRSL